MMTHYQMNPRGVTPFEVESQNHNSCSWKCLIWKYGPQIVGHFVQAVNTWQSVVRDCELALYSEQNGQDITVERL